MKRSTLSPAAAFLIALVPLLRAQDSKEPAQEPSGAEKPRQPVTEFRYDDGRYRTPRAGEGIRTEVFGREVDVPPRDRRYVSAWTLGLSAGIPGISGSEVLPIGSLYFFRRPDEDLYFRCVAAALYNQAFLGKSAEGLGPFEGVFTFENFTVPAPQSEKIDGRRDEDEELYWGYVRAGAGIGLRRQLEDPGGVENTVSLSLVAEPGYFYFGKGKDTADEFKIPQDTFEFRGRLILRYDGVERNLLDLAHRGLAFGADLAYGARSNWEDWGMDGGEGSSKTEDHLSFSGYVVVAGGIPFVRNDRHRLIGRIHGGVGDDLDRFSSFRLGGGPSAYEAEVLSTPIIPGTSIQEFPTSRYAIGLGEYRFEPIFFTYLSVRAGVAYLERLRYQGGGIRKEDDWLPFIGWRITTGFFLETELQIDYAYNFGVIRDGEYGGHEITAFISRSF